MFIGQSKHTTQLRRSEMCKHRSLHISLLQSCEHRGNPAVYEHFVPTGLGTRSDSVRFEKTGSMPF